MADTNKHTMGQHQAFIDASSNPVSCWKPPEGLRTDLPVEQQVDMLYDSVCIKANEACRRAFRQDSLESLIGKRYGDLIHGRGQDSFLSAFVEGGYRLQDHPIRERILTGQTYYGLDTLYGVVEDDVLIAVWSSSVDITQRQRSENVLQARLRLMQYASGHTLQELLVATVDEAEALTDSTIGFFHFFQPSRQVIETKAWSTNTSAHMCAMKNDGTLYAMDNAGAWADCIREKKPIICNDYRSMPSKRGLPEGHAEVSRFLTVPVFRKDDIVAVLGVGNKARDYVEEDVETITLLADMAWDVTDNKRNEQNMQLMKRLLEETEELGKVGGWEYDVKKDLTYWTDNLYRLFGYEPGEFLERHKFFTETIVHPEDRARMKGLFTDIFKHRKSVSAEYRAICKDGETRTFRGVVVPQLDDRRDVERIIGANQDITLQKRAEEALQASQDKYRDAQQIARMGHWELDIPNNILRWSDGVHQLFGLRREDFASDLEAFYATLHPEDRDAVKKAYDESLKNRTPYDITHRIIRGDGKVRYMHERCDTIYDDEGSPLRSLGTVQDVTEMRQSAQEQQRNLAVNMSLARLYIPLVAPEATIQTAAEVVMSETCRLTGSEHGYVGTIGDEGALMVHTISKMMDLCEVSEEQKTIVFPPDENGVYPSLWGYSLNTHEPFYINDIQSHPAGKGAPEGHIALGNLLSYPVLLGKELVGQITLANKKGGYTQADVELVGRFANYFALAAQRMHSEQALTASRDLMKNILTGIRSGIIIVVPETHVVEEINDVALEMLGGNREDYVGKECDMFCWERRNGEFPGACPTPESGIMDKETKIIRKDGSMLPIQQTVLEYTIEGEPRYIQIIFDITERKNMERRLNLAQKMESIGQLSAGIAHEINTPSQFLGDNLEFMDETFRNLEALLYQYRKTFDLMELSEKDRATAQELKALWEEWDVDYLLEEIPNALAQSREGLDRITSIVKAMKRFSHPGTESRQYCDINESLEKTSVVCRNEWKYHSDMVFDFQQDMPPVPCYMNDLNQVFLNLMVNAAHAMTQKHEKDGTRGKITLRTRLVDDWVEISIIDTGTGIPEDVMPKIFDPFFTTKEVGKGTGQGLALSYSIIKEKHRGTIDFQSEMGVGTTCIIRLPLVPEELPTDS